MYKHVKKHKCFNQKRNKAGDIVGTFAWNHAAHVELYYGIAGIGAVCHPINLFTYQANKRNILLIILKTGD
jgi:fatty-acyl-CoA synthase